MAQKIHAVKCPSCGAIPSVPPDADEFVCEYCGTESWVERSRPSPASADAAQPDSAASEPSESAPAADVDPAALRRLLRRVTAVAVVIALLIYFFGMQVRWLGQDPVLLHDVNGDQLADPIGMIISKTDKLAIAALDARDGDELWRSESLGSHPDDLGGELWRTGDLLFFTREVEAPLAFDARTGERRFELPAMGKIRSLCGAEDSVVFVIDSGNRRLHFADGSIDDSVPDQCVPAEQAGAPRGPSRTKHAGIARLTDRVEGDIVLGPDAAYAMYEVRGEDVPRITAFELGDGPQRWDAQLPRDAPLGAIVPAEDRVYVSIWGTLVVYEAATGETMFEVGL